MLLELSDSRSPSRDTPPHLFSTPKHQSKVNVSNISDMSHISEVQSSHSKSVESEQTSSFLGFSSIDSSNNNSIYLTTHLNLIVKVQTILIFLL